VSVESVIPGYLVSPQGERFVLAQSTWHQPNGEDANLSLFMEVNDAGNIILVRGLAYNEYSAATSYDMFYGFTFNREANSVNMSQTEIIRLQRETGAVEVFSEGGWRVLEGQEEIITQTARILRGEAAPLPMSPEVENRWQLSPDGHIFFNEAELFGGEFTIDTEHPEYSERLWENLLRGIWRWNYGGNNWQLLNRFPSADSFVEYWRQGGAPISNLQILVPYPRSGPRFNYAATWEVLDSPVDLSVIAVSIYNPTREEILDFNSATTPYITWAGALGEVLIERIEIEGRSTLRFTFRKDMLSDDPGTGDLALSHNKTPEENQLAAAQLINDWVRRLTGPVDMDLRQDDVDPPLMPISELGTLEIIEMGPENYTRMIGDISQFPFVPR
jgi:hypothetical protein